MMKIGILKNSIQEYAWGSHTAIADLAGRALPSKKPQAELWMGAHPKAPSLVKYGDRWISLLELIKKNPVEMLGKIVSEKFNNQLPYLFKVLAVARPLSIQAHPDLEQARRGFAREDYKKIPIDAFNRNYRDANHKPECICAMTRFWGLNGFRRVPEIISRMRKVCGPELSKEIDSLESMPDPKGLQLFFKNFMSLGANQKKIVINKSIQKAAKLSGDDPIFEWMVRLHDEYPGDAGVFAPVILNLICLEPGQAIFIRAGELHAYLKGMGMEIMANSDNVVRGGLTKKYLDVSELVNILSFVEKKPEILVPLAQNSLESVFPCPAKEFILSIIRLDGLNIYQSPDDRSLEIILCTKGKGHILDLENHALELKKGTAVMIPSAVPEYTIKGKLILYKAAVSV
ncbi:MAG: mannose-6-phosphate isomerase, class I [Deltaproteobacteria bacterium]|nr:mannose-6-phosphate isomerase, class I [Deltaproteobacteria bacterium]